VADIKPELMQMIVHTARTVPSGVLRDVCLKLDNLPADASTGIIHSVCNSIAQPDSRRCISEFLDFWASNKSGIDSQQLSIAFAAAGAVDTAWREQQSIELVWTGPTPEGSTFRRTDQALYDLINHAQHDLLIVTFAAYDIPEVLEALKKALSRGVHVKLVLESDETDPGRIALKSLKSLSQGNGRLEIYEWPVESRPRDESGHHGKLHVKCAVADEELALVSSANLTRYALNLNMELGLLISGGEVPNLICSHIANLVSQRALTSIVK
jgi:phosphatidylserine/phosphatidylglycerophosphate/cardiolipin synthase-like enzyme